jgi:glucose/arabinose dehydrogenase
VPANCTPPSGGFPGTRLAANYPTALAWSPDGRLFWAERSGQVKVYEGGAVHTFAGVSVSTSGERGLLGLAISGSYVFAFFSNTDGANQTIIRWTDCGGSAKNPTVIASGLPAGSDCCHKGGRLAVSPDGHLFATIGDNHFASGAQNWGDLRGKVIRFNLDGSGRTVWTAGLRNPFGIAFAPDGTMGLTNNGPSGDAGTPCGSCGDEFYLVGRSPGILYQWATCWGYSHPFPNNHACTGQQPQFSTEGGPYNKSNPYFYAPTGVTWSTGAYNGHFLFCANSNGHMYEYLSQGSVSDTGLGNCSLDVKQGPGGVLYSSDSGAIYRH